MIRKEEVFKIGRFVKPHGISGEIALVTDSEVLDCAEEDDDLYVVCEMDGILVPFFIEDYRYKTDSVILLKLKNIDNEQVARELTNRDVFYPFAKVEEADWMREMTWDSLVGFQVMDRLENEIGTVQNVDDSTANVLMSVMNREKEFLLPVAEDLIVSIDHESRILMMEIPEGLLDL